MAELTIASNPDLGPLDVTVYAPGGDEPVEFTLSVGAASHTLTTAPGASVVVARRLDGRKLRRSLEVREGSENVLHLGDPAESPIGKETGPPSGSDESTRSAGRSPVPPARKFFPKSDAVVLDTALQASGARQQEPFDAFVARATAPPVRLFRLMFWELLDEGTWIPATDEARIDLRGEPTVSEDAVTLILAPAAHVRCVALLDIEGFGPVVYVPPFAVSTTVAFLAKGVLAQAADRDTTPGGRRVAVAAVEPSNVAAASLLAALASPDTPSAEAIFAQAAPGIIGMAAVPPAVIPMLLEKFEHPAEALLAAHYLLRFLPSLLPIPWADNLVRALPVAADGPAIAAWARVLNRPETESDEEVDDAFRRNVALALERPVALFARTRQILWDARHLLIPPAAVDSAGSTSWGRQAHFRRHGAWSGGFESFWGGGPLLPGEHAGFSAKDASAAVLLRGGHFRLLETGGSSSPERRQSARSTTFAAFVPPNQYQARSGWRQTLAHWVEAPPGDEGGWQHQIGDYWRWRTVDGMPLREAWTELGMTPDSAKSALDPDSPDSGLIPPELFSRVLARSRAYNVSPYDNVEDVVIAPTPPTELPDRPEVGFTPARTNPPRPAIYQPRAGWKARLALAPALAVNWSTDLHIYWRRRTEGGLSPREAWADVRMRPSNARTSLNKDLMDRGSIPPEIIGRVVARAQADDIDPDANVEGIILYPELTV